MRSRRPKSLLLALWLAVQLVLGPVTGASACAQAPGGVGGIERSCCGATPAQSAVVEKLQHCCCSGGVEVDCDRHPAAPEEPGAPGGCDCSHQPAPDGLPEPIAGLGVGAAAPSILPPPVVGYVRLARSAVRGELPPRTGPPGGPGLAIHVRYCVFLI